MASKECCGLPRTTRFCPDCGKKLADPSPGADLLEHLNGVVSRQKARLKKLNVGTDLREWEKREMVNLPSSISAWEARAEWVAKQLGDA
jgi:hypothetical protein